MLFFERLDGSNVAGDVDECDNVDGKLAEDRTNDVGVEDVGLRAFFGKCFDGLRSLLVVADNEQKG